MIQIPDFQTKKELFKFLHENKDTIITAKKSVKKESDGFNYTHKIDISGKLTEINKEDPEPINASNMDMLNVTCIINTTNIMDSHNDVHIPGLWNKSLQENKMLMHLQQHEMEFDYIIADGYDLKAYVKYFKWTELGYYFQGITQALVFDSNIKRSRNEFMLNQYANGWVRNHSVGMRYIKLGLAMNDIDYPNEFDAWNKYYPEIANKEKADEVGYFYYVLEAQLIEGSAVPLGSNYATPTISIGKETINEENKIMKLLIMLNEPLSEPERPTQEMALDQKNELLRMLKID